jgi:hypothetical protein
MHQSLANLDHLADLDPTCLSGIERSAERTMGLLDKLSRLCGPTADHVDTLLHTSSASNTAILSSLGHLHDEIADLHTQVQNVSNGPRLDGNTVVMHCSSFQDEVDRTNRMRTVSSDMNTVGTMHTALNSADP